ncbi:MULTISPECIES: GntR family transcriptional regulator [unclassified Streptomyces]|uniref:GntR family transcriptional regulator n=1 Tax=unclassified Streptomyces TaxID=2593676 RepID=UPI00226EFDC4|nr:MULTISPECIES: GntR family transcriptional regulator [unclassified Streptomyces]MCY0920085.1 GntR family transcriptional regulator [Streptomyces sp. H27-G5]MCY0955440.1 GntR family transcriptional regulator [Streptomyces sp. H27-H5]
MVVFRIERRSGLPAYLQIVQQVEQALRMGALVEGDKLPTAAQVAASTKVNPNTTLKAYRELERAGLVEVRQGAGTFVLQSSSGPLTDPESPLRAQLGAWMRQAREDGLTPSDVTTLFDTVHAETFPTVGTV